jgi:hypothetical protein
LSESAFEVNLGEKCATSKLLRDSNGIVDCSVAKSDRLWVDVVIDTEAIRGREVRNYPPGAVLLGDYAQARAVEGGEGRPGERSCHAPGTALVAKVLVDGLWVDSRRWEVGCTPVLVWPLIAYVEAGG